MQRKKLHIQEIECALADKAEIRKDRLGGLSLVSCRCQLVARRSNDLRLSLFRLALRRIALTPYLSRVLSLYSARVSLRMV